MRIPARTLLAAATFSALAACAGKPAPARSPSGASTASGPAAPLATDASETLTTSCLPPAYYRVALGTTLGLTCSGRTPLFHLDLQSVPDLSDYFARLPSDGSGRVVGRATLHLQNTEAMPPAGSPVYGYFWNSSVTIGAVHDNNIIGDDLCPGYEVSKPNFGYGEVSRTNAVVTVTAQEGSSPTCTDGVVQALPDSELDLWLEDPTPDCQGGDIAFVNRIPPPGQGDWGYGWLFRMSPILSTSLTTTAERNELIVLSTIEGTVGAVGTLTDPAVTDGTSLAFIQNPMPPNPNRTCYAETYSLVTQPTLDGAILSTHDVPVPASQGTGHLVIGSYDVATNLSPGAHQISLTAGADLYSSPVVTGTNQTGDAALIVIRP